MASPPVNAAPPISAQDENGVDLTLLRRALALTPLQRLRELQAFERFIASVRAKNPQLGPRLDDERAH